MAKKPAKSRGPNWVFIKGFHETIGYPLYPNKGKRVPQKPWGERDGRRMKCIGGLTVIQLPSTSKSRRSRRKQKSGH